MPNTSTPDSFDPSPQPQVQQGATFRVTRGDRTYELDVGPDFLGLPQAEQSRQLAEAVSQYDPEQTQQPPAQPDTSYSSALRESARSVTSGLGATARVLGNATGSDTLRDLGTTLSGAVEPARNYQAATPEVVEAVRRLDVQRALSALPRAVVENVGSLGATLAGGAIGGAVAGPPGALLGAYATSGAQSFGQNVEARAANNGRQEPSGEDLAMGGLTTAAQAGLEAFGAVGRGARLATSPLRSPSGVLQRAQRLASRSAREGASEVADQTVQQVGTTLGTERGLDVDPAEALGAGLIGAGTRGAMGAPGAALRGSLETSVRIAHDAARGELSPEEAASVERVNTLLSRRFDNQASDREVPMEDLLNGARTELDGSIGRQLRRLRRDGWIGDGEDHSRLRDVFETARRHNQSLAEGNTSAEGDDFTQTQGLRAVDEILGHTPEAIRENMKALLRDLDTLSEASRKRNLIGPFATLGGAAGRAAAVVGGAMHSGPVGALGGLLGSPVAATIGRRLGGMVDRAGGYGTPSVVLSRTAAQRALRRAGVEEGRASTDLIAENDRTLADRAAMRRAVLGLPPRVTPAPEAIPPRAPPSRPTSPDQPEIILATPRTANQESAPGSDPLSTASGVSQTAGRVVAPEVSEAAGEAPMESLSPLQRATTRLATNDTRKGALRGWRRFVQTGIAQKGRVATLADIEDAVRSLREDGILEGDEADAMLAERGRIEDYRLLDELMERIAERQGWSIADTPDMQLTAAHYAGIRSPARWEGAKSNYQGAATRAVIAGEQSGDWEMAELAGTMAASSEARMSGASRVMRVEALIASAPNATTKARREAFLRPLIARWQEVQREQPSDSLGDQP